VQICIMAGCEYLPSIQGVGLKVAVKHFDKHATIEAVLEALKKNKTFKERITDEYLQKLKLVQQLFFYQTVYDPRVKKLVSLSVIPLDMEVDKEYLGPEIDAKILPDYVKGLINKSTMGKRECYGGVIDFKKMLEDYRSNSINEKSFICLDKSFFGNPNKTEDGKKSEIMDAIERLKRKRVKEVMNEEDFGFCNNDNEEREEEEEEKVE
jgi:5'-3' exonuclease